MALRDEVIGEDPEAEARQRPHSSPVEKEQELAQIVGPVSERCLADSAMLEEEAKVLLEKASELRR
jgi:hypothetical protein